MTFRSLVNIIAFVIFIVIVLIVGYLLLVLAKVLVIIIPLIFVLWLIWYVCTKKCQPQFTKVEVSQQCLRHRKTLAVLNNFTFSVRLIPFKLRYRIDHTANMVAIIIPLYHNWLMDGTHNSIYLSSNLSGGIIFYKGLQCNGQHRGLLNLWTRFKSQ